jgi:putative endonuclease
MNPVRFLESDRGQNVTDRRKYWVYVVASRTGTLYIGMPNNLYVRVAQHKGGEIEGFSSRYHCNRLVYWESFDDVLKAIDREKQFKGWRRANEDCSDRVPKSALGRLGRKVGLRNGVCGTGDYGTVRTPCFAGEWC